ncbi:aroQ [Acrasis kona]|uniref:AroQ n=1 Tax=Acrasis kona TaxID=1008807 RepID=A0AAW2YJR7_9EUKA
MRQSSSFVLDPINVFRRSTSNTSFTDDNEPQSAPSSALLSRSFSDYFEVDTPVNAFDAYRMALEEYESLTRTIKSLRRELKDVAIRTDEWKLKYSSRVVFASNTLVSIYLLGRRTIDIINDNYAGLLRYFINPKGLLEYDVVKRVLNKFSIAQDKKPQQIQRSAEIRRKFLNRITLRQKHSLPQFRIRSNERFNAFLIRTLWPQLFRCALFVFSGYWLMNHESNWKRNIGFVTSLINNIYWAMDTSEAYTFGIYLNMLSLLIYLTAKYFNSSTLEDDLHSSGDDYQKYDDDIGDPLTPLSAVNFNHRFHPRASSMSTPRHTNW